MNSENYANLKKSDVKDPIYMITFIQNVQKRDRKFNRGCLGLEMEKNDCKWSGEILGGMKMFKNWILIIFV